MKLDMQKILNLQNVDNSEFSRLCQAYVSLVSYWNSVTNLVSGRDVDNLLKNLIYQSISPLSQEDVPSGARVLDVGSGAGIPALPLKFVRPDFKMTLLEPRRKKTLFLQRVVEELNLADVELVRGRLEEVNVKGDWDSAFDLVTTRGTGSATALFPQIKPLICSGGACWFYKGTAGPREANELKRSGLANVSLMPIDRALYVIIIKL